MKGHGDIGVGILSGIEFPFPVVPIVKSHHENWDGTGYPMGLRGEAIPLAARILTVVDCFDAVTSERPYPTYPVPALAALAALFNNISLLGLALWSASKAAGVGLDGVLAHEQRGQDRSTSNPSPATGSASPDFSLYFPHSPVHALATR